MNLVWRKIFYGGVFYDVCDVFCINNGGRLYKIELEYSFYQENGGSVEVIVYEEDHYNGFQSQVCKLFDLSEFDNIDEQTLLGDSDVKPYYNSALQCLQYVHSLFYPLEYISFLFGGI